ncbi:MAG TPA: BPSS1780 family membrane protein [Usitatibacter sp.]|nr:BPSS1780 family membrane protein [Usitatibacter sp.]
MNATVEAQPPPPETLIAGGRGRPAGEGASWIGSGWRLFTRAALMWILAMLILFVIYIVANFIPIVGPIVMHILNPVFAAGLMVACASLDRGGEFELEHLFAGFKRNFASLLVVGIVIGLVELAILLAFVGIAGIGLLGLIFTSASGEQAEQILQASLIPLLLGTLVALALMVPVFMAYWFAPALVVLHDMEPMAALKESFKACLRNIMPSLIYGILMFLLGLLVPLTLGLGLLVWVPLFFTSTYAAYRDIFIAAPAAAPA